MEKLLRGIDFPLLIIYLLLVSFGILNIYSVSETNGIKQLSWLGASLVVGIIIFSIRAQFFETYAGIFYIIGLILLVLLFPLGSVVNGAKAWFKFGPISLQPVELVKIGTTLMMANYINSPTYNFNNNDSKIRVFSIILIPIILILAQPDVGSILVFTAFFIALFREGLSGLLFIVGGYFLILFLSCIKSTDGGLIFLTIIFIFILLYYASRYFNHFLLFGITILLFSIPIYYLINLINWDSTKILITFIIALFSVLITIYFKEVNKKSFYIILSLLLLISIPLMVLTPKIFEKLPKHQKERIGVLFEGEAKYRDTAGYNLLYAKTAIGSGGFWGKGFNNGTVTDGKFVPEQHTDYIFCTVGEEWGFVGSAILLIVYASFILRIYYVSDTQKSTFTRVVGYCMGSIFFMHFIINIGMVIGLFPTVGIPLPYFSYGGSSLLAFSTMFFIFMRLHYFDNRVLV